jgi:hypothetical protein
VTGLGLFRLAVNVTLGIRMPLLVEYISMAEEASGVSVFTPVCAILSELQNIRAGRIISEIPVNNPGPVALLACFIILPSVSFIL